MGRRTESLADQGHCGLEQVDALAQLDERVVAPRLANDEAVATATDADGEIAGASVLGLLIRAAALAFGDRAPQACKPIHCRSAHLSPLPDSVAIL